MIIKHATKQEIDKALAIVNKRYNNNIIYKNFEYVGKTRHGSDKHRVTLRVKNSRDAGAKRGFYKQHTINACWHVHGYFMDALPEGSEIVTAGRIKHPGENWDNWNIGSIINPMYYSEACNC